MIMKTIKIFSYLSLAALLCSCYKADPAPELELPQFLNLSLRGATTIPNVKKMNFETGGDTTFVIQMQYGGTTNYHKGEITAELGVDASLVESFNAANFADYQLLPSDVYAFGKATLTIPDGSNKSDEATLIVKTRDIDYTQDYILPITIKSVSGGVPANDELKTIYFVFEADVDTEPGKDKWKKWGVSSIWDATVYDISNIFDGDDGTYWHSHPFDASLNGMPQWFSIDMGNIKRIDGFTFNNRKEKGMNAMPKHITIETSLDGEEWTQVLEITALSQSRVLQILPLTRFVFARYFRFTILSTWSGEAWTYVAEMSIYAGAAPDAEEDFELANWTTDSFSSQWNVATTPDKLLDGDKNTYWHSNPVGQSLPQWIIYDMQKSRRISGFKIWNRQEENYDIEPKHIVFELSNDKSLWETLIDEPEMSKDKTVQIDLKAPEAKSGRYLRMTIHTNWSSWPYTALGEITPY